MTADDSIVDNSGPDRGWGTFGWQSWMPLAEAGRNRAIPATPGLYRVRIADGAVIYIGQTGNSLRGRLSMLRGCYGPEMPYNDPHTAGPGLWALRHRDGCVFEASVVPLDVDKRLRLGLEAVAITQHRLATGASPLLNFGGMPPGYRKSTGNNAKLVAAGLRRRGGPDLTGARRPDSAPVHGPIDGAPAASNWLGFNWSEWVEVPATTIPVSTQGLYRLRRADCETLVYVGQGRILGRLLAHRRRGLAGTHRQSAALSGPLLRSTVILDHTPTRHRLEFENDLIASHMLAFQTPPEAQYLG